MGTALGSSHLVHGSLSTVLVKNDKANITLDEKTALQFAGKLFLELSAGALLKALQSGVLLEVYCEQDH